MEIKVVIKKWHLFLLITSIILVGFAFAQPAPNPGHTVSQVAGATRSCIADPTRPECVGPAGANWLLSDVAIASGVSYNSQRLEGLPSSSFCRSDGTNCPPGTVLGGGENGRNSPWSCSGGCHIWGVATCPPFSASSCGVVLCPSGSTARITGYYPTDPTVDLWPYYLCIKN